MKQPDIVKYCNLMEEIKLRSDVIDFFISGQGHALFEPTTLESVGLQLRKILELIAMASLVANKSEYEKVYTNFAKSWNAEYLLKDIGRVNPNFYPQPKMEVPSSLPGRKPSLTDRPNDYLSKEDFIDVYKRCGGLMHASNPYGRKIAYGYFKANLPEWHSKIINLLNNHVIQLLNDKGFYLIHMHEERDNKVHFYRFELRSGKS